MKWRPTLLPVLLLAALGPGAAYAQSASAPAAAQQDDPDRDLNVSQPDFTVVALPTTLRVPKFRSAFRLTHRFHRSLSQGTFGDAASNFFGLDNGASIGLEYRFGLMPGLEAGVMRTSGRAINLFAEYNVLQQGGSRPVGVNVLVSADGTNNFRDEYSPVVGLAISRELGKHGAVYFDPMWVHDANLSPATSDEDRDTFIAGVGLRVRVRPTVYATAEVLPRAGYSPSVNQMSFAIEKRAGGHTFQLNVSNGFAVTPGEVARGGITNDDWYLGFNLSRKFF
jgi:hypothetical protein